MDACDSDFEKAVSRRTGKIKDIDTNM